MPRDCFLNILISNDARCRQFADETTISGVHALRVIIRLIYCYPTSVSDAIRDENEEFAACVMINDLLLWRVE